MRVFGLPRHVSRSDSLASRIAAKSSSNEAAIRRELVRRWRQPMCEGLTTGQAARAMGASRASLYRWQRSAEAKSRRPHRLRKPAWPPALAEVVGAVRADNPMWGKRKLAAQARGLRHLRLDGRPHPRAVVTPVPTLRRKPGGRRFRLIGKHHARSLPQTSGRARSCRSTLSSSALAPGHAHKHFTAYDPVAKWAIAVSPAAPPPTSPRPSSASSSPRCPSKVSAIQVDGSSEFRADFEEACKAGLDLNVLPAQAPQLNGAVERCKGSWRGYAFH